MKSNYLGKKDYLFFENIQDMVKFLEQAPRMGGPGTEYATDKTDSSFYGKYTYAEALEKLKNGDSELANSIENIKDQTMTTNKILQSFKNDVHGFMPNVPHAIMGLPKSMINVRHHRISGNNKIIDLVLDSDASCSVTSEDYAKVAKTFLNVVDALEKQGYRLNLYYALNTTFNNGSKCCWLMKLKTSGEPFNKYKCAFPLGSVSMFRRLGFRLIETLPSGNSKRDIQSGYGRPNQHPEDMVREAFNLNNISIKNLYIFNISKYIGVEDEQILKTIKGE